MNGPEFSRTNLRNEEEDEEEHWRDRVAPAVAALVLIGTLIIVSLFVDDVRNLSEQNRENNLDACERGNVQRVADIQNLRADIAVLESDIKSIRSDRAGLIRLAVLIPSPQLEGHEDWILAKENELDRERIALDFKRGTVHQKLAAISTVAIRPGSPVTDCARAYPE